MDINIGILLFLKKKKNLLLSKAEIIAEAVIFEFSVTSSQIQLITYHYCNVFITCHIFVYIAQSYVAMTADS